MNHPISVGLLFGGKSPEHEVSIASAKNIIKHLDKDRFIVRPIGIARNGVWVVNGDPIDRLISGELPKSSGCLFLPLERGGELASMPDVFFNTIHGFGGEDGQIQGFLETLNRPYTGAGLLAMAASMDKWITKQVWAAAGLPVVPYVGCTEESWRIDSLTVLKKIKKLGLPVFIKPANLGSSIGIEKVKDWKDLPAAIDKAFTFDRRIIIEQGLFVRELEVAILGGDDPLISVPGEIIVTGEFYDFKDKYLDGKSSIKIPADLSKELVNLIIKYAAVAFKSLDGYGMARVDYFLDCNTGQIFLNEINLIPGFTSISMYPELMKASGINYKDLLSFLIDLAFQRYLNKSAKTYSFRSGSEWFN